MPKGRKGLGGVAGGRKYRKAGTAADSFIEGIAVYMEIANAARNELIRQKALPMGIGIRLEVERDFCMNVLQNICKLKQSYIQKLRARVCEDKEKFKKEVQAFCDAIVPEKKRIILSQDYRKEVAALEKRDRGIKKGGVII